MPAMSPLRSDFEKRRYPASGGACFLLPHSHSGKRHGSLELPLSAIFFFPFRQPKPHVGHVDHIAFDGSSHAEWLKSPPERTWVGIRVEGETVKPCYRALRAAPRQRVPSGLTL
jgi:hypothetical protein